MFGLLAVVGRFAARFASLDLNVRTVRCSGCSTVLGVFTARCWNCSEMVPLRTVRYLGVSKNICVRCSSCSEFGGPRYNSYYINYAVANLSMMEFDIH